MLVKIHAWSSVQGVHTKTHRWTSPLILCSATGRSWWTHSGWGRCGPTFAGRRWTSLWPQRWVRPSSSWSAKFASGGGVHKKQFVSNIRLGAGRRFNTKRTVWTPSSATKTGLLICYLQQVLITAGYGSNDAHCTTHHNATRERQADGSVPAIVYQGKHQRCLTAPTRQRQQQMVVHLLDTRHIALPYLYNTPNSTPPRTSFRLVCFTAGIGCKNAERLWNFVEELFPKPCWLCVRSSQGVFLCCTLYGAH